MLQQLYPKSDFRLLILGNDASGKTNIAYQMKLGEFITTMPTIGFNVETIRINESDITMWDVGGCDKIRPLGRHYYKGTDALIHVFDVTDPDRFGFALDMFNKTLEEAELKGVIVLVFFNKMDMSFDMPTLTEQEHVVKGELLKHSSVLFHIQRCSAKANTGLQEGFDWLQKALKQRALAGGGVTTGTPAASLTLEELEIREKDRLEYQLEEWLSRDDQSDDEFLAQLRDFSLPVWDHRTHLRIAWLLLTRHGRREGMRLIFRDIKQFIEHSPRTTAATATTAAGNTSSASSATSSTPGSTSGRGVPAAARGTTFHETMTYFWVHMVHFALATAGTSPSSSGGSDDIDTSSSMVAGDSTVISPFKKFLLMNPQLCNGGLFMHYYSRQRMLNDPDARTMVLLPDKVPLPSLLVDVKALASSSAAGSKDFTSGDDNKSPRAPLTDAEFLLRLSQSTLPGWGHEVKLRVLYLLLCAWGRSKHGVDAVLAVMKTIEGSGYHLTLEYFWIQLLTLHIIQEAKHNPNAVFSAFNDPTYTAVVPSAVTNAGGGAGGEVTSTASSTSGGMQKGTISQAAKEDTDQGSNSKYAENLNDAQLLLQSIAGLLVTVDAVVEPVAVVSADPTAAISSPSNPSSTSTATAAATLTTTTAAVSASAVGVLSSVISNTMPFAEFIQRPHCQALKNALLYDKYYSRAIVDSEIAAREMHLPDLKPFPSVVT